VLVPGGSRRGSTDVPSSHARGWRPPRAGSLHEPTGRRIRSSGFAGGLRVRQAKGRPGSSARCRTHSSADRADPARASRPAGLRAAAPSPARPARRGGRLDGDRAPFGHRITILGRRRLSRAEREHRDESHSEPYGQDRRRRHRRIRARRRRRRGRGLSRARSPRRSTMRSTRRSAAAASRRPGPTHSRRGSTPVSCPCWAASAAVSGAVPPAGSGSG
jgi:hypothetical protein